MKVDRQYELANEPDHGVIDPRPRRVQLDRALPDQRSVVRTTVARKRRVRSVSEGAFGRGV